MERIGENIVEIQTLTQQILNPAPDWLPGWQLAPIKPHQSHDHTRPHQIRAD